MAGLASGTSRRGPEYLSHVGAADGGLAAWTAYVHLAAVLISACGHEASNAAHAIAVAARQSHIPLSANLLQTDWAIWQLRTETVWPMHDLDHCREGSCWIAGRLLVAGCLFRAVGAGGYGESMFPVSQPLLQHLIWFIVSVLDAHAKALAIKSKALI